MPHLNFFGGFGDFNGGVGYSWEQRNKTFDPVLDIVGDGTGWTKETHGPVKITGNGERTVVRLTGAGAWKIVGGEELSG